MDYARLLADCPERQCTGRAGTIAYREAGAGPALVLLHGISSGAASWAAQLGGLRDEFRVIAWDAPGYGASSPLAAATPRASNYAEVLADLVDALSLEAFTLVGHSLGALMAAAYAQRFPQRVNRLVLMSPARGYGHADSAERERKLTHRLAMLDRLGPEGLARERASALLSPEAPLDAVSWVAHNMRRIHPEGYRQAARMLADEDIGRYATPCEAPVSVLSGEADTITPVERCRAVAAEFGNANYECMPALGHALYIEDPARINTILSELDRPRA